MNILMFIIAFCLIADALLLVFDPSVYRKSLIYVNEMIGTIWSGLYGFMFSVCGVYIFISVVFSGISLFYILSSLMLSVIGLFFLLSTTEKFHGLTEWWSTRSNWQYRAAGFLFASLAGTVFYIIFLIK